MRTLVMSAAIVAMLAATASAGACPPPSSTPAVIVARLVDGCWAQAGYRPGFKKLYRKIVPRELVWFNGVEGDLERHARIINGEIYITLTDFARHLGCVITWGPSRGCITVSRGDFTVILIRGSLTLPGRQIPHVAGPPAVVRGGVTWVPVRKFAELFGAQAHWNSEKRRLDVTFPEPGRR